MHDLTKELNAINEADQHDLASSLKEINELANEAFKAKNIASEKEAIAKEFKAKLSSLMESAGVDKISADACTVSGKMKANAGVPKDHADKLKLFGYIMAKDNNGVESVAANEFLEILATAYPTLLGMVTINPISFNSWYGKEVDAKIAEGEVDFKLEYINTYEYYSIGMRKKKGV